MLDIDVVRRMGSQGLKEEMCGQQSGECKGGAVVVMVGESRKITF